VAVVVQAVVEVHELIVYAVGPMFIVPDQAVLKAVPSTQVTAVVPLLLIWPTPPPSKMFPPLPAPTPVFHVVMK
jgi:hypothetical protein